MGATEFQPLSVNFSAISKLSVNFADLSSRLSVKNHVISQLTVRV